MTHRAVRLAVMMTILARLGLAEAPTPASVSCRIADVRGEAVSAARVQLVSQASQRTVYADSDADGQVRFDGLVPGIYTLAVHADGFASWVSPTFTVESGQDLHLAPAALTIEALTTSLDVGLSPKEVASEQMHQAETQRIGGVLPNFFVVYDRRPVPLSAGQKMHLAFRAGVDPSVFIMAGIQAGLQQSQGYLSGYGQGAAGYGRRYGAAYGDGLTGALVGQGLVPVLLRQDPRYFYQGTGSKRSRFLYALASGVRAKGDNGKWQPNYSLVAGSVAGSLISNLYYPRKDRSSPESIVLNVLVDIGSESVYSLLQEFAMKRHTRASKRGPSIPAGASATSVEERVGQ